MSQLKNYWYNAEITENEIFKAAVTCIIILKSFTRSCNI